MIPRKIIFLLVLVGVLCTGMFGIVVYYRIPRKMDIAFYDMPQPVITAVQQTLKQYYPDIEKIFEWTIIPDDTTISRYLEQNPRTAFVFAPDQKAFFSSHSAYIPHAAEDFTLLPSTFLNNFFSEQSDSLYGFPVLANPLSSMYNTALCQQLHLSPAASLAELEMTLALLQEHCSTAVVCAGGNDTELLMMVSGMAAMQGIHLSEEVFKNFQAPFDLKNGIPPELRQVLDNLVAWRTKGWLHPEWFRLLNPDIEIFMEFENTGMVFMPFLQERNLKTGCREKYTTAQIPLPSELQSRRMAATIIMAGRTTASKERKEADTVQTILQSYEVNEDMARAAQLAPVFSNAQTDDSESAAARYWIAVSNTALPDSGHIACTTAAERAQLAAAFRRYFEVNGVGY